MEGVIAKSASVWQQKIGENKMQKNDLVEQITLYLSNGGLFNPELANHVAVRDLLIECREALAQQSNEQDLSEQGRNRSAVIGNNIEAMMDAGLPFLKALETTLKVYDHDIPKIGCVNHDCNKCKAQPDPLALQGTYTGAHIGKEIKHKIGKTFDELIAEAAKPPAVPEEIAKYVDALVQGTHEITEVTIRPKKTWVGLSEEDWDYLNKYCGSTRSAIQTAETLLKEKNT